MDLKSLVINYIVENFNIYQTLTIIFLILLLIFTSKNYVKIAFKIPYFKYFNFVGIFIHELSHYLMCKLTGAKVIRFKVNTDFGYVVHAKPKIPIIGKMLISLAPYVVGLVLLVTLVLNSTSTSIQEFNNIVNSHDYKLIILNGFSMLNRIEINLWFLVYLFLFLNIAMTFVPSKKDLKNITVGLMLYFIVFGFFFSDINQVLISSLIIANILVLLAASIAIIINSNIYLIKYLTHQYGKNI